MEASLLRALDDRQLRAFQVLADAYHETLSRTADQVDRLWTQLLRRPQQLLKQTEAVQVSTSTCLQILGDRRREIGTRLAKFVGRPESTDAEQLKRTLEFKLPARCNPSAQETADPNDHSAGNKYRESDRQ